MSFANIIRLELDRPRMTSQQLADLALAADREARALRDRNSPRALWAQMDADELADACARRAMEN